MGMARARRNRRPNPAMSIRSKAKGAGNGRLEIMCCVYRNCAVGRRLCGGRSTVGGGFAAAANCASGFGRGCAASRHGRGGACTRLGSCCGRSAARCRVGRRSGPGRCLWRCGQPERGGTAGGAVAVLPDLRCRQRPQRSKRRHCSAPRLDRAEVLSPSARTEARPPARCRARLLGQGGPQPRSAPALSCRARRVSEDAGRPLPARGAPRLARAGE